MHKNIINLLFLEIIHISISTMIEVLTVNKVEQFLNHDKPGDFHSFIQLLHPKTITFVTEFDFSLAKLKILIFSKCLLEDS